MEEVRLREQEVGVGIWVAIGNRKGGQQVGVAAGLSPHHALSLQELSKREVVAVGHLEVPAELAGLLRAVAGVSALDSVVGVGTVGTGTWPLMPSSLHRPQANPGAPGGPCADAPVPGGAPCHTTPGHQQLPHG